MWPGGLVVGFRAAVVAVDRLVGERGRRCAGAAVGRPDAKVRLVRIQSLYGDMLVVAGDGAWPWPYGREISGYGVTDLAATIDKAKAAGVTTLIPAHDVGGRQEAMLQFPGGFIAAVHGPAGR